MSVKLSDLSDYRSAYQATGIKLPLVPVAYRPAGLMAELPEAGSRRGWAWTEETDPLLYHDHADWPKITIVTPSYNQAAFLEMTIRSVLLQNYPNLEYIVVDGGSTDGSLEIIKKYASWLSFGESTIDRGQGHAINKGFSLASGAYYAWINSDDYYLKGAFSQVVRTFLKYRSDFVYGYALNYKLEAASFQKQTTMLPVRDYFLRLPSLAQPSCFWSAIIHQPIWEALNCSLDYELWLRMIKGKKRRLIKTPLSVATIHDDAKTSDPKMRERWHEDHLLICAEDAHGPVWDWDTKVFLQRVRFKIYKLLRLTE